MILYKDNVKNQPGVRFLVKYNKRRFRIPELFTIFADKVKISYTPA
ncbi:hypothetical protein HMPREF9446_02985 [Bacteroides fluxus YIT 12057]|uniref:Uncharacterized protein n=1 Tax=Bacteroides fluxus YIT 12057 TaxID=763034 RepID=F3PW52_9BACE|nr:hypothetical protein HMPREF9446_02985 [Bacteroides fluxus YIT 12057]